MKTLQVHCPFHGKEEEIQVPDGYGGFEGEVKCASEASVGNNNGPFVTESALESVIRPRLIR